MPHVRKYPGHYDGSDATETWCGLPLTLPECAELFLSVDLVLKHYENGGSLVTHGDPCPNCIESIVAMFLEHGPDEAWARALGSDPDFI